MILNFVSFDLSTYINEGKIVLKLILLILLYSTSTMP